MTGVGAASVRESRSTYTRGRAFGNTLSFDRTLARVDADQRCAALQRGPLDSDSELSEAGMCRRRGLRQGRDRGARPERALAGVRTRNETRLE